MTAIEAMRSVAKAIDDIGTGYNQYRRWSFIDVDKRELIPNKEADCSSVCGAVAYLAGLVPLLGVDFYTGNAKQRLEAAGWKSRPYAGLSDLKQGEMVLNTGYHIEFMYDDNIMFSANSDENGNATGGQPGDQTGKEVYFKPKYTYRKGWQWVLTPPAKGKNVTFSIAKNYNPAKLDANYVTQVQNLLVSHGYKLSIDGDLGPATYAAIKDFQKKNNLNVDGLPGTATLARLKGEVMANKYIVTQGVKMAPGTNYYYQKLRAAFKKATGLDLLLTSGYRTYAEQKSLYDRWKAGTFYAPSVAYPGTSLHESGRALDLRDSGTTAGVTVAGNARSNWMRANASKYGFNPTGYNFREPWHFELQPQLNPWVAPSGGGTSSSSSSGFSIAYIRDIQRRLGRLGYSVGSSGADGNKGPATNRAIKAFQKKYGLVQDAQPGPATLEKLKIVEFQKAVRAQTDGNVGRDTQKRGNSVRLASAWGGNSFPYGVKYTQSVVGTATDGSWGKNSIAAHDRCVIMIQRAVGVNQDGIWGPTTDLHVKKLGV